MPNTLDFSTIKALQIPEGNVTMITCGGVVLWTSRIPLPEDLIAKLIDFEYEDNGNGTATLTAWKETLNGVSSTACVVPDDNRIIL